jgi:hypothetical protein
MQDNTLTSREFLQVHEPANNSCSACSALVRGSASPSVGGRCSAPPSGACVAAETADLKIEVPRVKSMVKCRRPPAPPNAGSNCLRWFRDTWCPSGDNAPARLGQAATDWARKRSSRCRSWMLISRPRLTRRCCRQRVALSRYSRSSDE